MHVLGHGFGQRRKSSHKRPRDLHIRKVSFSGSSLSSGCSLSSSTSSTPVATPTARTPTTARLDMDPLHLNPAFHAPPRLFERPFKNTSPVPVFCDNDEEDLAIEPEHSDNHTPEMAMPSHVSPVDDSDHEQDESQDYIFTTLSTRPTMNRSRWSESTIDTLDLEVTQDDDSDVDQDSTSDSEDDEDVLEMRRLSRRVSRRTSNRAAALQTLSLNLTYNRPNAPKRPPMRSLDSVDNYIRRGGWKRRGIIFRSDDMDGSPTEPSSRASY